MELLNPILFGRGIVLLQIVSGEIFRDGIITVSIRLPKVMRASILPQNLHTPF